LAFFSGSAEPILETQALGTSNALCGSFYYERTATITSPASTPAQSIPKSLLGSWTVRRELPASTISCWAQDQADKLIGTEIEYSADTLRWRDIGAINPEVEVKTVTANQFMKHQKLASNTRIQKSGRAPVRYRAIMCSSRIQTPSSSLCVMSILRLSDSGADELHSGERGSISIYHQDQLQ
jgi:hypothetical protein